MNIVTKDVYYVHISMVLLFNVGLSGKDCSVLCCIGFLWLYLVQQNISILTADMVCPYISTPLKRAAN